MQVFHSGWGSREVKLAQKGTLTATSSNYLLRAYSLCVFQGERKVWHHLINHVRHTISALDYREVLVVFETYIKCYIIVSKHRGAL